MVQDLGNLSDGYHTFNELYEHRHWLFITLMCLYKAGEPWRSMLHDDGSSYDGWFIAGMTMTEGQISYHLPLEYWNALNFYHIKTYDKAPPFDGHTSEDVIKRLSACTEYFAHYA